MPSFRRVDGSEAGPTALGILVPPGKRTLVILRPRHLECDLLPLRADTAFGPTPALVDIDHKDAPGLSQRIFRALEAWVGDDDGRVEIVDAGNGQFWVRVAVGSFILLVFDRRAGQPYCPRIFATLAEATTLADQVHAILCPPTGTVQELYFNTKHFSR